jgi:hypothetical protein
MANTVLLEMGDELAIYIENDRVAAKPGGVAHIPANVVALRRFEV